MTGFITQIDMYKGTSVRQTENIISRIFCCESSILRDKAGSLLKQDPCPQHNHDFLQSSYRYE